MPAELWKFLHHLTAFVFVGALLAAHWNVLAARRSGEPARRAVLFESNARVSTWFGLPALVLLGVFGNLAAASLGYRMRADAWLRWVNGLWVVLVLVELLVDLPATRRLAAAVGGEAERGALARWRMANGLVLALFLVFLALMVYRWRF